MNISNFLTSDQKSIDKLINYNSGKDCDICMFPFNSTDILKATSCLHAFHDDCITTWIKEKDACPICRKSDITRGLFVIDIPIKSRVIYKTKRITVDKKCEDAIVKNDFTSMVQIMEEYECYPSDNMIEKIILKIAENVENVANVENAKNALIEILKILVKNNFKYNNQDEMIRILERILDKIVKKACNVPLAFMFFEYNIYSDSSVNPVLKHCLRNGEFEQAIKLINNYQAEVKPSFLISIMKKDIEKSNIDNIKKIMIIFEMPEYWSSFRNEVTYILELAERVEVKNLEIIDIIIAQIEKDK